MEWQTFLVGAAMPPLLFVVCKSVYALLSAPRPDSTSKGLKVVITGSSKGLGKALADKFLSLGDDVVVSSRSMASCQTAVEELREKYPERTVLFKPCDVSKQEDTDALADYAVEEMGRCDIWVNNAGVSQSKKAKVVACDPKELKTIIDTNLLGALHGSRSAIRVMEGQDTGGKVFLMDGRGSHGEATPQNIAYGASKRALPQLTRSLASECRKSPVSVHITSPGMVITDLLVNDDNRNNRGFVRIMNILAEMPDTVAEWMVPRMRGVKGNGRYFRYLTAQGVLWRFANAWRTKERLLKLPARQLKTD